MSVNKETIISGPTRHLERVIGDGSIKIQGTRYPVFVKRVPVGAPTIVSVATTNGNWTALATGLTNVIMWRIAEISGNNVRYAFSASPGDAWSVAFGWISFETDLSDIYIQRPGNEDITVKLEYWTRD